MSKLMGAVVVYGVQPKKVSKANQDEKDRQDAHAAAAQAIKAAADARYNFQSMW